MKKVIVLLFLALGANALSTAQNRAGRQYLTDPGATSIILLGDPQGYMKYDYNQPIFDLMTAWIADNVVYVTNAPINAELVVYTMSGVVVTSLVTTTPYTTIDVANMPTGVYMLRLNDKVYKFVCK